MLRRSEDFVLDSQHSRSVLGTVLRFSIALVRSDPLLRHFIRKDACFLTLKSLWMWRSLLPYPPNSTFVMLLTRPFILTIVRDTTLDRYS